VRERLQADGSVLDALARSESLQLQGELARGVEAVVVALCALGLAPVTDDAGATECWEIVEPADPIARLGCALCLKRLGALYRAQGRADIAESTLQASIRILSGLPDHADELAHAHYLLAGLLGTVGGRSVEARKADQMSMTLSSAFSHNCQRQTQTFR
jgi:F420-0:gamma-glutamyl ligase